MNPSVIVNQRGAARVRHGHLWVYRSDVAKAAGIPPGAVVRVADERGRLVGTAMWSDRSEISLRFLSTRDETIDREWWRERLRRAIALRAGIAGHATAYRLVYSEGDLLPGLIVDLYDRVVVIQTLAQGTDRVQPLLVELLVEALDPAAVIERNDVRVRELEGLEKRAGVIYGEPPGEITIEQHGLRFLVTPDRGQKTGSFLDQRENQVAARQYGHGRALDGFTSLGGFALNLARACESVTGLDISAEAIASASHNAELNEIRNVEFRVANVFDALREFETSGTRFGTIVLDPPAFARSRATAPAAIRGYKEINLRALKLLENGGTLISCTCSYHVSETMFLDVLGAAATDAHRRIQIVEKRMQAADHPVLLGVPETFYLKCVIARVFE